MSMYSEYLLEKTSDQIVETDKGFATYRFTDDKTVYIIDIYVKKDFRDMGVARDIGDYIMDLAKKKGCTKMLGSVVPSNKGSAQSMKVLLAYGMVPDSCTNDFILFKRDI